MLYNIKDFTKELNIYNTVEFRKLENYDNYYIYEDGRVLNIKSKRFLKFNYNNNNGYCRVELCDNNKKRKKFFIHRLVYETFKGQIPVKLQVDHVNGIRDDNRLINLRLLTPKENSQNRHNLEQYKEMDKKLYLKNKTKNNERTRKYYQEHKQENKKYREENKDKIKEQQKEYYKNNKEKFKKYQEEHKEQKRENDRKYRERHREELNKKRRERYNENKEEINRKRREKYRLNKLNKMN